MPRSIARGSRSGHMKAHMVGLGVLICGADAQPVTFPVETGGGHILLSASIAGDGPHVFFLDTGAQQTTIKRRLAERLGLNLRPLGTMHGGGTGALTVHQATDVPVSVGPFEFVEPVLVVLPEETGLGDRGETPIEGILGATLIKRHVVSIDYGNGRLTLMAPDDYEVPKEATVFPIRLAHDFPYFEGQVVPSVMGEAGPAVKGNYLLDLGANHGVLLDHGPAKKAGLLDVDDPDQRVWGIGAGIDGTPRTFRSAPAVSVTLGGVDMATERIEFETSPGMGPPIENLVGNVGGACFKGKVVTLDYANLRVIVSESPKATTSSP